MVEFLPVPSIIIGAVPPPGVTGIKSPFVLTLTEQPLQADIDTIVISFTNVVHTLFAVILEPTIIAFAYELVLFDIPPKIPEHAPDAVLERPPAITADRAPVYSKLLYPPPIVPNGAFPQIRFL